MLWSYIVILASELQRRTWPADIASSSELSSVEIKSLTKCNTGTQNKSLKTLSISAHKFNDNYRVRSWRSDAINYYITYCQIADLKLLTEN